MHGHWIQNELIPSLPLQFLIPFAMPLLTFQAPRCQRYSFHFSFQQWTLWPQNVVAKSYKSFIQMGSHWIFCFWWASHSKTSGKILCFKRRIWLPCLRVGCPSQESVFSLISVFWKPWPKRNNFSTWKELFKQRDRILNFWRFDMTENTVKSSVIVSFIYFSIDLGWPRSVWSVMSEKYKYKNYVKLMESCMWLVVY